MAATSFATRRIAENSSVLCWVECCQRRICLIFDAPGNPALAKSPSFCLLEVDHRLNPSLLEKNEIPRPISAT
jgi:hypothetical protein